METPKQDPQQLLRSITRGEKDPSKGSLKILFGYAAGVGKTYAMLQEAHQAKARGINVVAGYIEPHARPQTAALLEGLEQLPCKDVACGSTILHEFDIDAALKRRPQLILVDELAHTNAQGSRHSKRYQDVQELLAAGIDVYTTVNVQHIESLNDTVSAMTGIVTRERIPDPVFDQADQVELVDIEPAELLERMDSGCIYKKDQAERARANFFTMDNLTALREIALRRCADRVNLLTERARIQNQGEYRTDEHILVCLSSSPSNAKIIRTAARMARAFRGVFTALFVETPNSVQDMREEDEARLRDNIHLAQQLGATVETSYGEDVSYQIAEFARLSGVTKIVIGRSTAARKSIFSKPSLTEQLINAAPNLDIHVIPDASAARSSPQLLRHYPSAAVNARDIMKCISLLLAATVIGYVFYALGVTEANIVSLYIFAVLLISVMTHGRFCGLFSSMVAVLVFNFFFTVPRFTFQFNDPNYLVTFTIMFMVSLLSGSLAARLKENAKRSAYMAYRTKLLFDTDKLLQKAQDEEQVIQATAGQLLKLMGRDLAVYLLKDGQLSQANIFRAPNSQNADLSCQEEKSVALWVLKNNTHAGATTDTLSNARCLYLAIRVGQQVYGVLGIDLGGVALDPFENSVLLSILGECALALENIKNAREKEEAAILAKNEQLRADLLRTISHDLRTPLTSISGNAANLLANYQKMDDSERKQSFSDIYDDSMWLIDLVENLLAVTRIEGGQVSLKQSMELIDEVVTEALRHLGRKTLGYDIQLSSSNEMLFVRVDAKLIVQVVINLVDNALKYTAPGSYIEVRTEKKGDEVLVSVADNGPGIPDELKPRVFDMFFCGANKVADSRRSLGIGLSLCRSIINAHDGRIWVQDNEPRGAVFCFTLPAGEVELHE